MFQREANYLALKKREEEERRRQERQRHKQGQGLPGVGDEEDGEVGTGGEGEEGRGSVSLRAISQTSRSSRSRGDGVQVGEGGGGMDSPALSRLLMSFRNLKRDHSQQLAKAEEKSAEEKKEWREQQIRMIQNTSTLDELVLVSGAVGMQSAPLAGGGSTSSGGGGGGGARVVADARVQVKGVGGRSGGRREGEGMERSTAGGGGGKEKSDRRGGGGVEGGEKMLPVEYYFARQARLAEGLRKGESVLGKLENM